MEVTLKEARAEKPSGSHGGWLKDPRKTRKGEKIGGGVWIFRRGDGTGRVRPAKWPYEHPNLKSAQDHIADLMAKNPGHVWEIVASVQTVSEQKETTP